MTRSTVHLVRHGRVENPLGVIYGRLPGYHLSETGQTEAEAAARRLAGSDILRVVSSPLERAQETAEIIAAPHGIEVVTDERLTESDTTLEGMGRSIGAFLRTPGRWWSLRNPARPSWGESFAEIRARMLAAVNEVLDEVSGHEAVLVSHQTPLQAARLGVERKRVPPWMGLVPCATGSVTTMTFEEGRLVSVSYFAPR